MNIFQRFAVGVITIAMSATVAIPVFAKDKDVEKTTRGEKFSGWTGQEIPFGQSATTSVRVPDLERWELPTIKSNQEKYSPTLFIGPQGQVRIIKGEVMSIESAFLKIKVWGLTLTVDVKNSKFLPEGNKFTPADIKVGDTVSIQGTMDQNTGVVTAAFIRRIVPPAQATGALSGGMKNFLGQLQSIFARFHTSTATSS